MSYSNSYHQKSGWNFFSMAILLFLSIFTASPAPAEDTPCTGALSGDVDNVVVPGGSTCNCDGATVKGNIKVYGSLDINRSTVGGNIDAEPGHGYVRIGFDHAAGDEVIIGGNVQLKGGDGGGSGNPSGFSDGTTIKGNFQYEENSNNVLLENGTVGGNLKVEKNTGTCDITGNTIGGNLECKENASPCVESGNTVSGDNKCNVDGDDNGDG